MREIKFRAWDKIPGKSYVIRCWDSIKRNAIQYLWDDNTFSDRIIMQFTGLYDKNRKEIYEGDIVKYFQPYSKRTDIRFVKWDCTLACFGCYEKIEDEWCDESDWLKIEDIEIIGNIHENPELLGGE